MVYDCFVNIILVWIGGLFAVGMVNKVKSYTRYRILILSKLQHFWKKNCFKAIKTKDQSTVLLSCKDYRTTLLVQIQPSGTDFKILNMKENLCNWFLQLTFFVCSKIWTILIQGCWFSLHYRLFYAFLTVVHFERSYQLGKLES